MLNKVFVSIVFHIVDSVVVVVSENLTFSDSDSDQGFFKCQLYSFYW